jgi:hypothetical protein
MIELVKEQYPKQTMMARRDFAKVTKQRVVQNPYWFRDRDTGREYHGLYSAIGWPQRIAESGDQLPGYSVIVGVVKDKMPPEAATMRVLAEFETKAEEHLIDMSVQLRKRWGFGAHPALLRFILGDHRICETVLGNYNARVIDRDEGDSQALIVSPPDDYDNPRAFDVFMGRLRTVLTDPKRLYLDRHPIITNRLRAFQRDDPAIMALGGLVHTLLLRTPWMEQATPGIWQMPEIQSS